MPAKRNYTISLETLEPRIALSSAIPQLPTYPPGFIGPISRRVATADIAPIHQDIITGMTLSSTTPALGSPIGATLTSTIKDPTNLPLATTWTVSISYGGFTSVPFTVAGAPTSFSTNAAVPGTYTITAVTTYMSTNPTVGPHAPTTVSATATVAVPTTATKATGMGTPTSWIAGLQVTDTIGTPNGPLGMSVGGEFEENIAPGVGAGGVEYGGTDGEWFPNSYGMSWYIQGSTLFDTMGLPGMPVATWQAIPVGATLITYTQQLQFYWEMSTPTGQQSFTAPLNSLTWTWTKVGTWTWTAN